MAETTYFDLVKPAKTDGVNVSDFNGNMDIIDSEMHKPPLTVNDVLPDNERNIVIDTVPLADNLTSDQAQINTGTYIIRTSGGDASIADGTAWLSDVRGNQVKTGYVAESIEMTVSPIDPKSPTAITAILNRDTFVEYVESSGTITLTYTTSWSADPGNYGITVSGTPASGDQIVIVYVKENRGLITTANPSTFISTGWNLYNHSAGYARVVNYSDEYGFVIEGTYTQIEFSETLTGDRTVLTPVDGYFTIPGDGYVFVTGGNATDTMIWMTWSDWTEEPNNGVFQAYSQTSVDLSGVMVSFPNGLMRIGNYYDEINLNTLRAYSRIERLAYTAENLEAVVALGVPYDTDTNYIYAVRQTPVTYVIALDGEYTVSDHGTEYFNGTTVPVEASSLYGQDLKGKLRRDVLTISQQSLSSTQKAQVLSNIGAADVNKAVQITEQTFTAAQKRQARDNIGASFEDVTSQYSIAVKEYTGITTNIKSPQINYIYRCGNVILACISFLMKNTVSSGSLDLELTGPYLPAVSTQTNNTCHMFAVGRTEIYDALIMSDGFIRVRVGSSISSNSSVTVSFIYITG